MRRRTLAAETEGVSLRPSSKWSCAPGIDRAKKGAGTSPDQHPRLKAGGELDIEHHWKPRL